jgi:hypothetical protein
MTTLALEDSLSRRLTRLDSQLKIEYELIGHRVSWLLVSNSFLFGAFVVGINNLSEKDDIQKLIHILIYAIPIIGLASSVLVALAVRAAHEVISELKVVRDRVEEEAHHAFSYERLGVHIKSWPHIVGNWPPTVLPPLFAVVWARVLYEVFR